MKKFQGLFGRDTNNAIRPPGVLAGRSVRRAGEQMRNRPRDEERSKEAGEILRRVERDSQSPLWGHAAMRDRFAAGRAESQDWTEIWGRRIGRVLATTAAIGLLMWLWSLLSGGTAS
ncbi:hypothetical protein [Chelativorans sp. Marseille-P2723]|uniref:hypothetical protein n=1 Tax=Chelativorans sp. Marseille-P2723 TaxID=2709133 RepID=UPI001570E091|nr:hypothetical protein [Chelativorans sp. Marseille-P2723]